MSTAFLFLDSILVISSQDSSALRYREFTQEGAMTMSPFAAREGTSVPQWPNVKQCCRHLVPSSDFFVQSYAVLRKGGFSKGGFQRIQSDAQEDTKILTQGYGPQQYIWHSKGHSQKRHKFLRKPPLSLGSLASLSFLPFIS